VHLWLPPEAADVADVVPLRGDPSDPQTFARLRARGAVVVVDFVERERGDSAARAAAEALPLAPVLLIDREHGAGGQMDGVTRIDEGELLAQAISVVIKRAAARRRLGALRRSLQGAERCAFLVQHDPDPDAIASSLALRRALGFQAARAPIVTFGRITRPENRRLIDALRVQVRRVKADALSSLAPLVLVDVQPPYFEEDLGEIAAVIDHHPIAGEYEARYRDVRTDYGASATMAAEYLLAQGEQALDQQLATALLYGILTDTRHMVRSAGGADLEMFSHLFPRADLALLNAIQHPSYSAKAMRRFGHALEVARVRHGIAYLHLGKMDPREEHIVAQLAEFCLGFEGAQVSAVSAVFGGNFVMSTRALSPEAQLGDRLRELFGDVGSAGGHPVMAKAVIRLADWKLHRRIAHLDGVEPSIRRAVTSALRMDRVGES
jgi:nanoRNase/pAp phosphatase (c-di-AMP/oligoRNAs hydrolase)